MLKFSALFLATVLLIHESTQSLLVDYKSKCLGCICEAASGCNSNTRCEGDVCGPFRITWSYWSDSGKPTVNGESPNSGVAFQNCANDYSCSSQAVEGYIRRYRKDCNNDGVVNCRDYARIHNLGPNSCYGDWNSEFGRRFEQCISNA